ncbi:MAG: hypothetical protein H6590_05235 [Flavobacteriales bacterium]|nr:hypothetical protein [Flavobacteriales bacterium]MCB9178808.1 hypothetical protein [Flavobacteriales bacterium]
MRPASPSLILALAFVSCSQSDPYANEASGMQQGDGSLADRVAAVTGRDASEYRTEQGGAQGYNGMTEGGGMDQAAAPGGTRTVTIRSPQFNVPMVHIDVPQRWPLKSAASGDWSVDSPDLKVSFQNGGNFVYATGQFAQFYQQQGGQMRPPVSPDQLVQQDLAPKMRQKGWELIGMRELPQVAQADQRGLDGMYSVGQVRKVCQANVSEWRKGDDRIALVMHWFAFQSPDMTNWGYRFTGAETKAANFQQEEMALVNSLASVRFDPAYFAAYAQSEQQKGNQSWAAHNQRMQQNQANFDRSQAAHRDMVNSVNDAQMSTWRNNNASSDRMHDATIDMIRGEQNAYNPYTGQTGKVESGYQNYWVDQNGQYFGTNDVNYDPNVNGQWVDQYQQLQTEP